jgi:hypothetical protein
MTKISAGFPTETVRVPVTISQAFFSFEEWSTLITTGASKSSVIFFLLVLTTISSQILKKFVYR